MNTSLQPRTLESVRAAVLEHVPVLYRPTYERAFSGKSKAAAIKAACLNCCGNVRAEVTACAVYACPLFSHRPYRPGAADDADTGTDDAQQEAA